MPWKVLRGMERNKNQKPEPRIWTWTNCAVVRVTVRVRGALFQSADPDFSCFWLCPRAPTAWAALPCKIQVQLVWTSWDRQWISGVLLNVSGGSWWLWRRGFLFLSSDAEFVCAMKSLGHLGSLLLFLHSTIIIPQSTVLIPACPKCTNSRLCMAVFTKA